MGGTGGGLRGAPVPQRRLGFALLQAGRLRRRRPPGGGGGGLFLPLSRRPGRQEVSARAARCGEPGSWEQPQLDWKPDPGGGRQSVRRVDPRPRVPPLFPAAQAYPSSTPPPIPAHLVGGLVVPQLCSSPHDAHGALGSRAGRGTPLLALETPGSQRSEGGRGRRLLAAPPATAIVYPSAAS